MAPFRRGRGEDYLCCNSQNERPVSYNEACDLVRVYRARLPVGHPVG